MLLTAIKAPTKDKPFTLFETVREAVEVAIGSLIEGDILAISSKYVAIGEDRVVDLESVDVSDKAQELAKRYELNPALAQLVIDDSNTVLGGIKGFLLTVRHGLISPNAGIDQSNVPSGKAVLLPKDSFKSATELRLAFEAAYGCRLGILIIDSWLAPGRSGTMGQAVGCNGFIPVSDERGNEDLFGKKLLVTKRGVADTLSTAAQAVMGEGREGTPIVLIRGANVTLCNKSYSYHDLAIETNECIYLKSLREGSI
jgi:coenzyme F420-0:L-glutamate ligase / coenzyme F420-1:gamma-L-glutamate ligase